MMNNAPGHPSLIINGEVLPHRLLQGETDGPPIVLFHGYGGDEDVMWILQASLPPARRILSPRAPFPAAEGGYSWVVNRGPDLSAVTDFQEGARIGELWLEGIRKTSGVPLSKYIFIGFSQGAALAFTLARESEYRPAVVASLAGFLPEGIDESLDLDVFWAHGLRDDQIPVERARADVARLEAMGARVDYCEEDTGHKVSAGCMRALKQYLSDHP